MMNNRNELQGEKDLLVVRQVKKKWKDFALKNISFTLPEGYILGLIGKNGAGKSTLMNCIIGCIDCDGEIVVDGKQNTQHMRAASQNIGFIVEDGPFLKKETLLKNGEIFGDLYDLWNEEKFHKLLAEFGLHYDMEYGELSKGMETKFQLAFALAHSPRLLILDEPTGGLDPVFRKSFLTILQNIVSKEMLSVIISTHLTTDLDKVPDYVMLLDEGEMVFYEDKEKLLDNYPLVSGTVDLLEEIPKSAYRRVQKKGNLFHTIFTDKNYLQKHAQLIEKVQIERTNLEDIMYYLSAPSIRLLGEEIV